MSIFKGSGTALVTPLKKDGSVNYEKFEELIDFQLENCTDALVVCGTTGESPTITDDEKIELYRLAVSRSNKRVPVIAGTGSNDTEHARFLSIAAQKAGADGLLVVTPYYNKTTPKGLAAHFSYLAAATDLPIIMYSVASRTGMQILPETAAELCKIPNISGIKEASGNIAQVAEIAHLCGDDLAIYSGNDDSIVPVLSLGGVGVISTMSNIIPKDTHDIVEKYLSGDRDGALSLQLGALGLIRGLFCEVNPIPVKAALNLMGKDVGGYRMPLTEMEQKNKDFLEAEMKSYGLL